MKWYYAERDESVNEPGYDEFDWIEQTDRF